MVYNLQPNFRSSKVFVDLSYTDIAICQLTRRRDACMCHFRYEYLFVSLQPVAIRRACHDFSFIHVVAWIRHA